MDAFVNEHGGAVHELEEPARARESGLLGQRVVFMMLVVLTVGTVARLLLTMIRANGTTPLEVAIFALTVVLLVPIAMSFWIAVTGFFVQVRGRGAPKERGERSGGLLAPTAIVFPVFGEDPARVLAGLSATCRSIEETGFLEAFEFFVLSDTLDPARWIEEELAFDAFRARASCAARIHYRNRAHNVAKKAGNIADFCRNEGKRFRYMIVFDADSVMTGDAVVGLVRRMEANPGAGIIQAPAVPVNRRTLFGRVQQFAARAYGPTWSIGLARLQGGEGNYYGHNAIVRIEPFREHCGLPKLPGKPPLGGFILSHDFVEAALMRRAGYEVRFATDVEGSFEEAPPTLIDYAVRDRRWCQGNLQHARVLGLRGLHPVSRVHLGMGILSYVASPLWMLLLVLSTVEAVRWHFAPHDYFASQGSLFPIWEVSIRAQATALFAIVMGLLFLPRVLAITSRIVDRDVRKSFGGAWKLVMSGVFETVFSTLVAPLLAVWQTQAVVSILLGRNAGWKTQARGDDGTSLQEAVRRHGAVVMLGLLWGCILFVFANELFAWMVPVLLGLVLAVPVSVLSSKATVGKWARRVGLFLTPEEVVKEPVLVTLREEWDSLAAEAESVEPHMALQKVLEDPHARAVHMELVRGSGLRDPIEEHAVQGLVLKRRLGGEAALSDADQRRLLLSASAVQALVEGVG